VYKFGEETFTGGRGSFTTVENGEPRVSALNFIRIFWILKSETGKDECAMLPRVHSRVEGVLCKKREVGENSNS